MRWNQNALRRLVSLAAEGHTQREAAVALGITKSAVAQVASLQKIHFHGRRAATVAPSPDVLRRRWAKLLPKMREELRAEVKAIVLDKNVNIAS